MTVIALSWPGTVLRINELSLCSDYLTGFNSYPIYNMAVYVGDRHEISIRNSSMNGRRLELSFPVCDYKEGLISEDTTLFRCETGMRGQYVHIDAYYDSIIYLYFNEAEVFGIC